MDLNVEYSNIINQNKDIIESIVDEFESSEIKQSYIQVVGTKLIFRKEN